MQVRTPLLPRLAPLLICLCLDLVFSATTTAIVLFNTVAFSQVQVVHPLSLETLGALAHPRAEHALNVPMCGAVGAGSRLPSLVLGLKQKLPGCGGRCFCKEQSPPGLGYLQPPGSWLRVAQG